MSRWVLAVVWAVGAAVPLAWWVAMRTRVDAWRHLPVPAALVRADGSVVTATGPASPVSLHPDEGLPLPGRVVRLRARDGGRLAAAGVPGGAVVLALPDDPVADRRDQVLAALGGRLAHDAATPLMVVTGHLDLLARLDLPPGAATSLAAAQVETRRLGDLVTAALTAVRAAAGGGVRVDCPAGALVEEAVVGLLPVADAAGVDVAVALPQGSVRVRAAEGDLVAALRNLLVNAVQHGCAGVPAPRVLAAVDATDHEVVFRVRDPGPGPGTRPPGLGLSTVDAVLAAHGTWREVRVDDGGTTVSFSLPRCIVGQ